MPFHAKFPKVNTFILALFFTLWAYTEIAEYLARDSFKEEVAAFMVEIEHDRLLYRVQQLEKQNEAILEK